MKHKYISNVASLQYDAEKCIGCGMCINACPHRVFHLENRKAVLADRDSCMECGACSKNCPVNAISVNAGVGCATAVINGFFGKTDSDCCCCCDSKKSNCC
jgi:NAD-dependent dihydropyrimidine dehydrogenase PreA subunit